MAKGGYANLIGISRGSMIETLTLKLSHSRLNGRFLNTQQCEREHGIMVKSAISRAHRDLD
jgi:hypothetical protein